MLDQPSSEDETRVDVVIIGAGLAGLTAGLCLSDANAGHPNEPTSFVLLEAGDRLGGRTRSGTDDLDFGGGYVGASQNYIQYLLRRYGIKTIEEYLPKDKQWLFEYSDGRPVEPLPGDDPLSLPGRMNACLRLGELDTISLEVRNFLTNPDQSRYASFDALSVQQWLDMQQALWEENGRQDAIGMSPDTVDAFVCSVRSAFSVEPKELSFFYLLYYAAAAGSYSALVDVAGGPGAAEGSRLPRGSQELVKALQRDIAAAVDGRIAAGESVVSIAQDSAGALVKTQKTRYRAKQVIVAMSPATSSGIVHTLQGGGQSVGLAKRQKLEQSMAACMGRTIKGFVKFKGPFWRNQRTGPRQQGLMGFLLSAGNLRGDYATYPLDWTLDNVWDDPDTQERRTSLMTFIVGASADYWQAEPLAERGAAVIEHLRRVYGFTDDALLDPTDVPGNYVEYNWPKEAPSTLLPSPAAMFGPGTFLQCFSALRDPIGVVHYAGSESALEWNGYMNGAVQSGFRAGNAVLAALGRKP